MKIRTKLSLIPSVFLLLMVSAVAGVVVYSIYNNAQKEMREYRETEIVRVQEELKDKVNMLYDLIDKEYKNAISKQTIEQRYGQRVKNVVEVAVTTIKHYQALVDEGKISLKQAQLEAKEKIGSMRYDDEIGYLWINDTSKPFAKMIMHPTIPSLNDKILDDRQWNTALGKNENLFNATVALTEKQGSGFVDYQWPKPTKDGSLTKMQPKVSYVSLYEPWGWIVGSGIYVDDAESDGIDLLKLLVAQLRYDKGEGYFFILTDELPFPKMVLHPILPELNGNLMDDSKWDAVANSQTEHLFTAIAKVAKKSSGSGFIDYSWPKPKSDGTVTEPLPKLTYARAFEPLKWVIGTGVYTDNIDKVIADKQATTEIQVRRLIMMIAGIALAVLLLSLLISHLFARSISKGLEELTVRARDISLGKNLDQPIESTNRQDEVGQLARAIERLQTSVKMMMTRMKKK